MWIQFNCFFVESNGLELTPTVVVSAEFKIVLGDFGRNLNRLIGVIESFVFEFFSGVAVLSLLF